MIKELVFDSEILSTPCSTVSAEEAAQIQEDLIDTITARDDAAAIAANQIGLTKAACVYLDDNEQPRVLFNPVLKRAFGSFKVEESCITREEVSRVTRFQRITVSYDELKDGALVNRKKEFNGWTAQIIQHMIDHCKGKLV